MVTVISAPSCWGIPGLVPSGDGQSLPGAYLAPGLHLCPRKRRDRIRFWRIEFHNHRDTGSRDLGNGVIDRKPLPEYATPFGEFMTASARGATRFSVLLRDRAFPI